MAIPSPPDGCMGYKMYAGLIMGCVLADIVIVQGTLQSLGNATYNFQNRNIYDGTLLPGDLITVRPSASHHLSLKSLCQNFVQHLLCKGSDQSPCRNGWTTDRPAESGL